MKDSNRIIGASLPRPDARRLAAGRGTFTDDIILPRMVHMALVRSPYAHAMIKSIDTRKATKAEGVVRVITGEDLADICSPFIAGIEFLPNMISPPQYALAPTEAAWQGEAVCAILAESRALAEDAAQLVLVEWEELPAVVDPVAALKPDSPLVHSGLESNLVMTLPRAEGDTEAAFAEAAVVVEHSFEFGRQSGLALETRSVIADFEPAGRRLTVYQSHQTPYQMQDVYARHLGLDEHQVRVIVKDVGGAFGLKLHAYPDEMAAVAASVLLGRPVKYIADRQESFASDIHAREITAAGRLAVNGEGNILGVEVDVLSAVGAYSVYPRTSVGEGIQAVQFTGAPYRLPAFKGRVRVVYQNKTPTGAYRAVGQPIGCVVIEQLLDLAAAELNLDQAEIRRRNNLGPADLPLKAAGGLEIEDVSLDACLTALLNKMDYEKLRRDQDEARRQGLCRGIGLATFVEQTAVGAGLYGPAGARISAQEGCSLRLEPSGLVRCATSATDQGQGTLTGIQQVVAETLGVKFDAVTTEDGDGGSTPYGGGSWASRGLSVGGEAARLAAIDLRRKILGAAAAISQETPDNLTLSGGEIFSDGKSLMALSELARIVHFRQDTLPSDVDCEMNVTRHFLPRKFPYFMANGIQASYLEVDLGTGAIKLLDHWVVEDCGLVVNPLLVDEQLRGGIVQGLGAVLYEHCLYDSSGQILTASLADYAVPLASEMPDIHVVHVENPTSGTGLGAKGAGEAGTLGAPAAVWCAVNDALRPLGAQVWKQPFTAAHIIEALRSANCPQEASELFEN